MKSREDMKKEIADRFVAFSVEHIRESFLRNLDRLSQEQISALSEIKDVLTLKRLVRLAQTSDAINDATSKGLYDKAEHLTSEIDLEE